MVAGLLAAVFVLLAAVAGVASVGYMPRPPSVRKPTASGKQPTGSGSRPSASGKKPTASGRWPKRRSRAKGEAGRARKAERECAGRCMPPTAT